ncbi:MAG: hypothetical protein II821_10140 [Treponema sp.]|nr:hypothetical protein [Treponema sp.]
MKKPVTVILSLILGFSAFAHTHTPDSGINTNKQEADDSVRNAFLPGLSVSMLTGFENNKNYPGFDFHYAFIQGVTEAASSTDFGGYYEIYAEIGFYKELHSKINDDIFFTYSLGTNISFEKFGHGVRKFLVPYFGAKVGGIYFNNKDSGLLLEPVLGIVLANTNKVKINYNAGLFLNTVMLSDMIGIHNSLVFNLNL